MKRFADKLITIFHGLEAIELRSALLPLTSLVDRSMQDRYISFIKQSCDKIEMRQDALSQQSQSQTQSLSQKLSKRVIEDNSRIGNEEVMLHSSKRAKTMLAISQSQVGNSSEKKKKSPAEKRNSFLDQLDAIDRLTVPKKGGSNSNNSSSSNNTSSSRLKCQICRDICTDPCVAKCGHTGCMICWMNWIKQSETCPLCRKPADKNSITRVTVKR